jgi:hypothetical protein
VKTYSRNGADAEATMRIPPHNVGAERAVLGVMLLERDAVHKAVDVLTPGDFFFERHRLIYSAIAALVKRNEPVDLLTVSAELKRCSELEEVGGPAALAALVEEASTAAHLLSYGAIVREKALLRDLIRIGSTLVGRAYADDLEVLPVAMAELDALARRWAGFARPLGEPLGAFLEREFPPTEPVVEVFFPRLDDGFIAGEEKLGKTIYALYEALCVALARPLFGRYGVSQPRRVLFLEEEDGVERVWLRVRALLLGLGLDPDAADLRATLDVRFRLAVLEGFRLGEPAQVDRLVACLRDHRPEIVYADALVDLADDDVMMPEVAARLIRQLRRLRREYGCAFRLVHHYRRQTGPRLGRGSQEMAGPYPLRAWPTQSIFFDPVGRTGRATLTIQSKDSSPRHPFVLEIKAEGPEHAPTVLRLTVTEDAGESRAARTDERVLAQLSTVPPEPAQAGGPGVSLKTLAASLKVSRDTVKRAVERLLADGRATKAGVARKNAALYEAIAPEDSGACGGADSEIPPRIPAA